MLPEQTQFRLTDHNAPVVIAELDPVTVGNMTELYNSLSHPWQIHTDDWDKTKTMDKLLRTFTLEGEPFDPTRLYETHGVFDPEQYYEKGDLHTLMNIDIDIVKSLLGFPVHYCTGKEWNFYSLRPYIRKRMEQIGDLMGLTQRGEHGLLNTLLHPEVEAMFVLSTANGGTSIDALTGELLVYKPIPLIAWRYMAENANLLYQSSMNSRIEQIQKRIQKDPNEYVLYDASKDPFTQGNGEYRTHVNHVKNIRPLTNESYFREIAKMFTREESDHLNRLQDALEHFAVFTRGLNTKINFVLDIDRIINDHSVGGLHQMWYEATGENIFDFNSFMLAFRKLSEEWGVTVDFNEAHGTVFVDVTAPGVDKALSQRLIKKVYQYRLSRALGLSHDELPKILSFSKADNNHPILGNDRGILYRTRAVVIGNPRTRYTRTDTNYPVYAADIYGPIPPMDQAVMFGIDSTILSVPDEYKPFTSELLTYLEQEHISRYLKKKKS